MALNVLHRYGIWLLTCPRSFHDPRIWRANKNSDALPTQFQRSVGVRYFGQKSPRIPNSNGFYCDNRLYGPPKSISLLLKGIFTTRQAPRLKLTLIQGHRAILQRSTGYVVLWAPHIRFISVSGIAHFVGSILVNETTEP